MRIVLFRHGPAGERDPEQWPDDAQRPLTSKGEQRTAAAAAGLRRLRPDVRQVFTSPLLRALQTAQVAARASRCTRPWRRGRSCNRAWRCAPW
jgi:phosphohistidine phosphatase